MKIRVVIFTIDRAGEMLLSRLAGTLPHGVEIIMVVTREDRVHDIDGNPVVNVCSYLGIECVQPDFKKNEYVEKIKELNPDLIIVSNFHKIIKKSIIEIPRLGIYNLHSSLLPKLRGGTSIVWALKQGLEKTGVTLHVLTEGVDDGDIISQQEVEIDLWDNQGSLYDKITVVKHKLLLVFLNEIILGRKIIFERQDHTQATFLPLRKEDDGKLDSEATLLEIYNHIRSFDPWTGAFFPINEGEIIRLRKAIPVNYLLKSKVTDTELIICKKNKSSIKSLIIKSVTKSMGKPEEFDKESAIKVLNYWNQLYDE